MLTRINSNMQGFEYPAHNGKTAGPVRVGFWTDFSEPFPAVDAGTAKFTWRGANLSNGKTFLVFLHSIACPEPVIQTRRARPVILPAVEMIRLSVFKFGKCVHLFRYQLVQGRFNHGMVFSGLAPSHHQSPLVRRQPSNASPAHAPKRCYGFNPFAGLCYQHLKID